MEKKFKISEQGAISEDAKCASIKEMTQVTACKWHSLVHSLDKHVELRDRLGTGPLGDTKPSPHMWWLRMLLILCYNAIN